MNNFKRGDTVSFCGNDSRFYLGTIIAIDRSRPDMPLARITVSGRFAASLNKQGGADGEYLPYNPDTGPWTQYVGNLAPTLID